ncbi:MAG: CopD family protein [Granulosicoccus sp.]
MLWIKALHVIFMVTWFAGLFYLPRIFVYHSSMDASNTVQNDTFKVMERKLLAITNIGALLTLLFGTLLLVIWLPGLMTFTWMKIKLLLVLGLLAYHFYCAKLVKVFRDDANTRSHVWYRWFNEVPVAGLFGVVIMVIVRPLG